MDLPVYLVPLDGVMNAVSLYIEPPSKLRDGQSVLTRMKPVDVHVLFSPFSYFKLQNKYFFKHYRPR